MTTYYKGFKLITTKRKGFYTTAIFEAGSVTALSVVEQKVKKYALSVDKVRIDNI
jgi:hypothetical protein